MEMWGGLLAYYAVAKKRSVDQKDSDEKHKFVCIFTNKEKLFSYEMFAHK